MSFESYEKFYDNFSTEEELIKYIEENGLKKKDTLVKGYGFYKDGRRTWESMKFACKKDLIVIRDKDNIKEIIDIVKNNNTESKNVLIYLDNKTYEDMNLLLTELEGYQIRICYTTGYNRDEKDDVLCTVDEFIGMRAAIDYYKSIIESENLSPVETIMYVYDIVKSFPYDETKEDYNLSRNTALVLNNNAMVCLGFCKLMKQILKELGLNARLLSVTKHERIIMKIDDETYGIKGLFVFDPTWDSVKNVSKYMDKDGKVSYISNPDESKLKDGETKIGELDGLCLYHYFMIPASSYKKVFPNEKIVKYETKENIFEEKPNVIKVLQEGLAPKPVKKLNLESVIKMFYKIKLIEGFPEETIVEQIDELLRINYGLKDSNEEIIRKVIAEETKSKTM